MIIAVVEGWEGFPPSMGVSWVVLGGECFSKSLLLVNQIYSPVHHTIQ